MWFERHINWRRCDVFFSSSQTGSWYPDFWLWYATNLPALENPVCQQCFLFQDKKVSLSVANAFPRQIKALADGLLQPYPVMIKQFVYAATLYFAFAADCLFAKVLPALALGFQMPFLHKPVMLHSHLYASQHSICHFTRCFETCCRIAAHLRRLFHPLFCFYR